MLNNDILRSLRYTLQVDNAALVRIPALADTPVTVEQLAPRLRKEDEAGYQPCPDIVLSAFLNGLIYEKRGKDESAPPLVAERKLNNNIVLEEAAHRLFIKDGRYSGDPHRTAIPRLNAGNHRHDARAGA